MSLLKSNLRRSKNYPFAGELLLFPHAFDVIFIFDVTGYVLFEVLSDKIYKVEPCLYRADFMRESLLRQN
ncbi:MAG: hypothetical protein ABRQ38_09720 [Candidatus Eremiobacterota bacterium]